MAVLKVWDGSQWVDVTTGSGDKDVAWSGASEYYGFSSNARKLFQASGVVISGAEYSEAYAQRGSVIAGSNLTWNGTQLDATGGGGDPSWSGAAGFYSISSNYIGHSSNADIHFPSSSIRPWLDAVYKGTGAATGGGISGWYDLDTGTGITPFGGAVAISGTQAETLSVKGYSTISSNALDASNWVDASSQRYEDLLASGTNYTSAYISTSTGVFALASHTHDSSGSSWSGATGYIGHSSNTLIHMPSSQFRPWLNAVYKGTGATASDTSWSGAAGYWPVSSTVSTLDTWYDASSSKYSNAYISTSTGVFEPALTKGDLTATSPIALDQTRQVIGGAAVITINNYIGSTQAIERFADSSNINARFYPSSLGKSLMDFSSNATNIYLELDGSNANQNIDISGYGLWVEGGDSGIDSDAAGTFSLYGGGQQVIKIGSTSIYAYKALTTTNRFTFDSDTNGCRFGDDQDVTIYGHGGAGLITVLGAGVAGIRFETTDGGSDSATFVKMAAGDGHLQWTNGAKYPTYCYEDSTEGEIQPWRVYGYPTGEDLKYIQISVVAHDSNSWGQLATDGTGIYIPDRVDIDGNVIIDGSLEVTNSISSQSYSGAKLKIGTTAIDDILDEDDLSSDSPTALATQQSIKKYVDDNAGGGITGWYDLDTGTGITAFGGAVAISGTQAETLSVADYIASSNVYANFLQSGVSYVSLSSQAISGGIILNHMPSSQIRPWLNAVYKGTGATATLSGMTDTNIPNPTSGNALAYDGSVWIDKGFGVYNLDAGLSNSVYGGVSGSPLDGGDSTSF